MHANEKVHIDQMQRNNNKKKTEFEKKATATQRKCGKRKEKKMIEDTGAR